MRHALLVGAVAALGVILVAVPACSGSDTTGTPEDVDAAGPNGSSGGTSSGSSGSSSGSSGSSGDPDGGDPDGGSDGGSGGLKPTTLKAGNVVLIGVTTDAIPHAIYVIPGAAPSLEAVPVAGGTPVVIATLAPADRPIVRGGVVAWYTLINAGGLGTINLWSKATGPKLAIAAASVPGVFTASKDGTRVAFSVGATPVAGPPTATALAVGDMAAAAGTLDNEVLTGASKMNIAAVAADNCSPDIAFEGNTFFGAYCTGTVATATAARLVTVPAGSVTPAVLIANTAANAGIVPSWQPDTAGTKLFVVGLPGAAVASQGKILTLAAGGLTATTANLEAATDFGFMLGDGSAAIYVSGTTIKRGTAVAVPVMTTLATGVTNLLDSSKDGTKLLVSTGAPSVDDLIDIHSMNTTTAAQTPAAVVATATTIPIGFNATGAHALYLTDPTPTGGKLKSKPIAGGAETVLYADAFDGYVVPTGTGVVALTTPVQAAQGDPVFVTISHIDSATGGTPAAIADSVPMQGGFFFSGKKLVYFRIAAAGAGLYVVDLP